MQDEKIMIIRNIQNENFFHKQIKKKKLIAAMEDQTERKCN